MRLRNRSQTVHLKLLITALSLLCSTYADADTSKIIEHIEVNAQKRPQDIQDVAVAVSAVSGQKLLDTVSRDIYDIEQYVTNFSAHQNQSATNSHFSIRGIGTTSQNFGFESSVGLYVDGIYRSRQNAIINDLIDLESVEILRGPQGTLFGKNTPAGAVNIQTRSPSFQNGDGFLSATLGNDNLVQLAAASSFIAIEDTLALRVSGFDTHQDGWIDDANMGDNLINNRNRSGVRLQALYTPAPNVRLRVTGDYAELDEVCCGALTWQDNRQALNVEERYGSDTLLMMPPINATLFTAQNFGDYTTALTALPVSKMVDKGLSAQLEWQLSDRLRAASLTAFRSFDSLDIVDTDFTDAALLSTRNDARQQAFSEELQFHYRKENLNAIAGIYYFSQNLDLDFAITTGSDLPAIFAASAAQLLPLTSGIDSLSNMTAGLIAPSADPVPTSTDFAHTAYQTQDSAALFAQTEWQFLPQWTLISGLRYTREKKTLYGHYSEQGPGIDGLPADPAAWPDPFAAATALGTLAQTLPLGLPPDAASLAALAPFQTPGWGYFFLGTASVLPRPELRESIRDNQMTGTLKLAWQASANLMTYWSYATGFKSGGLNTDRIAAGLDPQFDAEQARSLEAGLKYDWPDAGLRINMAAHLTRIRNFQASTFTGTGFNLQNAGDIGAHGLELELSWVFLQGSRIDLNAAFNQARFDSFERGTCWTSNPWHTGVDDPGRPTADVPYCSRTGDRLGFEPDHRLAVTLSQDLVLFDLPSVLSIDYQYTGDVMLDDSNDPLKYSAPYELINARWKWALPDWDADIILWTRNLFNETYAAKSGFDVPVQTGKIMAYPGRPRTFGVSVQKFF
ncbi:TonB-dependent receptor [Alteromonas aestuariivivens]|uniref:TonB-dependent receptor n=1 Tax=Alteromonas aestuariivivens TaxID=1938339 RepID=A0A3D8M4B8_9ALTE|nr:TonB-dependent receptor [Alteromonas aestuariivivens]RDV24481.1 TonB-dependent receptor [Alteromonas aestuariivivens]